METLVLVLGLIMFSWLFIHRLTQKKGAGPKTWPVIGASVEQLANYNRMHDWLVSYLAQSTSVVVPMPFTTYTYIAHPANVEHILKTNFPNYPKVLFFFFFGLAFAFVWCRLFCLSLIWSKYLFHHIALCLSLSFSFLTAGPTLSSSIIVVSWNEFFALWSSCRDYSNRYFKFDYRFLIYYL